MSGNRSRTSETYSTILRAWLAGWLAGWNGRSSVLLLELRQVTERAGELESDTDTDTESEAARRKLPYHLYFQTPRLFHSLLTYLPQRTVSQPDVPPSHRPRALPQPPRPASPHSPLLPYLRLAAVIRPAHVAKLEAEPHHASQPPSRKLLRSRY